MRYESADNPPELTSDRLINRRQLRELLPVSAMTIWRWEKKGRLPQHITIGRTSFWKLADVLAAIRGGK
jgi:predicted DNA-binding transcriptional regulator AlpA